MRFAGCVVTQCTHLYRRRRQHLHLQRDRKLGLSQASPSEPTNNAVALAASPDVTIGHRSLPASASTLSSRALFARERSFSSRSLKRDAHNEGLQHSQTSIAAVGASGGLRSAPSRMAQTSRDDSLSSVLALDEQYARKLRADKLATKDRKSTRLNSSHT